MIYKVLGFLFRSDAYEGRYTPRPSHLVQAVLLVGIGTVAIVFEYNAAGIVLFLFGTLLGFTVILGINWDKVIEYWETIDHVARTMMSIKDPAVRNEVWKSMGYNHVPVNAEIEVIETRRNEQGVFEGKSIKRIPVNPSTMQTIADKVLMSGKASFTEPQYKLIVPNYRKVQKELKDNKYIVKTKEGYAFNKKGIEMLYEYASEGVKLELKKERHDQTEA